MAVKRSLRDEGEETTVKFEFTGNENIYEITEIINKKIDEAMSYKIETEMYETGSP
jgi:predicted DNA-binding antitoxin AbrB/MazE fold protein